MTPVSPPTVSERQARTRRSGVWNAILSASVSVLLCWQGVASILSERIEIRRSIVLMTEHPVRFWTLVALMLVVAAGSAVVAVLAARDAWRAREGLKTTPVRRGRLF